MEYLDVIDEHGNYTGEVMERDKIHELNILHYEIGVFVINKNKEVLLQKRSANKKINPNKWGLCAGHVDSGEDIDTAAIRELNEEIGLNVSLNELNILEKMEVKKQESNSHITRYYYVYCNDESFKIQKEELSEVKWFKIDDIIDRINNNDDTLTLKSDRLYLLERLKELNS